MRYTRAQFIQVTAWVVALVVGIAVLTLRGPHVPAVDVGVPLSVLVGGVIVCQMLAHVVVWKLQLYQTSEHSYSLLHTIVTVASTVFLPPLYAIIIVGGITSSTTLMYRIAPRKVLFNTTMEATLTGLAAAAMHAVAPMPLSDGRTALWLFTIAAGWDIATWLATDAVIAAGGETTGRAVPRYFRQMAVSGWYHLAAGASVAVSVPLLSLYPMVSLVVVIALIGVWPSYRKSVTERAEQHASSRERDLLARTVASVSDAVMLVDEHAHVVVANRAASQLLGHDDLADVDLADVLCLCDQDGDPPDIARVLSEADGHRVLRLRTPAGHNDPRVYDLSVNVEASSTISGSAAVVVVRDVTEQARAARRKDDFLALVSHDLRTPLTPIITYAQTLMRYGIKALPEDTVNAAVEGIADRATHMMRLIEDLLVVAQLDAGAVGTRRVDVEVDDLLDQAIGDVMANSDDSHTVAHTSGPGWDTPVRATTDPAHVRQVLGNLLSNACKYSPDGTTVTVHTDADDDRIIIDVVDQGPGIPARDAERIFDRFERLDPDTSIPGTGQGLYIAREMARALGGDVELVASATPGSTFRLVVPRAAAPAAVPPTPPGEDDDAAEAGSRPAVETVA